MMSANPKKSVSKKPSHSGGGSVVKKPVNPVKSVNPWKSGPTVIETKPVWDQKARAEAILKSKPFQDGQQRIAKAWHQRARAATIATSEPKPSVSEIAHTFKTQDSFVVWLSCTTSEMIPDGLIVMKKEGGAAGKLTFVSPMTEQPVAECPIISERND